MFSKLQSFLSRHKRKFIVAGVVIGGATILSRYVRKAIEDWQERDTKEFLIRTQKQQHYESVERTCNQTALSLIPVLKESVMKFNDTEKLIEQLKESNCNKVAVWENLKILAFTKITLLVYMSSILIVTLRLQLNLIGGYMFRHTMNETEELVSSAMQEKYLSESLYLLNGGMVKLNELVKEKVELVLKTRSLKEQLKLKDIEQIFWAINSAINDDYRSPCQRLSLYILPNDDVSPLEPINVKVYQKIMSETKDLLESDEVVSLTSSSISRGFSYFMDNVAEYFIDRAAPKTDALSTKSSNFEGPDSFFTANIKKKNVNNIVDISHVSIPLAKVIPIINGLITSRESNKDIPYTWIQQLILMDNLKVLGANIYECFSV